MNERWEPSPGGGPIDFSIDVGPQLDTAELIPGGELDIATVRQLQTELDDLIEAGFSRIVIDLRRVEFIDFTAVHALVTACRRAERERWQLAIVPGRHAVHRLFEITGAAEQLPFTPATTNSGFSVSRLLHRPDGFELALGAPSERLGEQHLHQYPRAR
jgi:anti-anti-sigma factor